MSLITVYSKQMFGICMRMLGKKDDAEDVLQEAFVIALINLTVR